MYVSHRLSRPALQQLVAGAISSARRSVVPRRLTREAPAERAVPALDQHAAVLRPRGPPQRGGRDLGDAAAARTRLDARVGVGVLPFSHGHRIHSV